MSIRTSARSVVFTAICSAMLQDSNAKENLVSDKDFDRCVEWKFTWILVHPIVCSVSLILNLNR